MRLMIQTQSKDYKCIHCGKSFLKEKTLMAHMCEPKRRHLQKDEKRVQVGFMTFNKFYTQVQKSKEKTYAEFCKSSYYNAFVKFGSFVTNVQCLYPEKFIDVGIAEQNLIGVATGLSSENFNVFLELPLKVITRKLNYKVIPINWYGRRIGESKFKIKEVGSKYIFTLLYCFLEKILLNKK